MMKRATFFYQSLKTLFLILGIVLPVFSYAIGLVNQYVFILDTSLQKHLIQIESLKFPPYADVDFNKVVKCSSSTSHFPMILTDMDGKMWCEPTSTLFLKHDQTSGSNTFINITVDNQKLQITRYFVYDPWDNGHAGRNTFLLYLDKNGKFSYREIG